MVNTSREAGRRLLQTAEGRLPTAPTQVAFTPETEALGHQSAGRHEGEVSSPLVLSEGQELVGSMRPDADDPQSSRSNATSARAVRRPYPSSVAIRGCLIAYCRAIHLEPCVAPRAARPLRQRGGYNLQRIWPSTAQPSVAAIWVVSTAKSPMPGKG